MPLLCLEPYVYPETLFEESEIEDEEENRWWALYTRPRAEKALVRRLLAQQVSFFLPLYKKQYRSGKRTLTSYLPLFTGYVFLRGDGEAHTQALKTNLIAQTITVDDQAQLQDDLNRVYRLMESGLTLAPEKSLSPGSRVEIVSGSLEGMQGTVIHRDKKMRFSVEIKMLRALVSVEVEGWMIRPISTHQKAAVTR